MSFVSLAILPRGLTRLLGCGVICVGLFSGCGGGDSGPERYHLQGKVTFDGKPVASGVVYFEPDSTAGVSGPSGSASIHDGTYDTADGNGHVGGKHLVRVEGFDGQKTADMPFGKPIFVPYTTTLDLQKAASTQDIDVPASAAEGLQANPDPA